RSSPAGVVAQARSWVAGLAETLWAARSPGELLDTVRELEALRGCLDAVLAAVVEEVAATGAAAAEQWASTGDFLTHAAGARRGYGPVLVRLARALPGLPATAAGMLAGRVSREQAVVIARAVRLLPAEARLRAAAEEVLVEWAGEVDASELAARAESLLERLDPEGCAQREEAALARLERAAHRHRFLALVEDRHGGVLVKGRGTSEDAAVIKTALSALTAPDPTKSCGHLPDDPARDPAHDPAGDSAGERGCTGCAGVGRDAREYSTRLWDAWVEASQRLLDARVLPETHGTKPRVSITVDYQSLACGVGQAAVEVGLRVSAAAVRRLACDADLLPVVLGTAGEVLDVGRTARLVTPAIWKALLARDGQCRFPGCTRPPVGCDAHHIVSWLDGGPTSLDNLVLLCRAHHTAIHHTPWRVRLNPLDRHPEFLPPGSTRPTRTRPRHPHPAHASAGSSGSGGGGGSTGAGSRAGSSGAGPPPRDWT
ncbi:MAG TPA: DUF222 domain-containing protein, partial [Nocardioidaceae bacterium]